jgi:hypothetical protein
MLNMRALEGDEGRIPEGSLQPENAALFQPAPSHSVITTYRSLVYGIREKRGGRNGRRA